MVEPKVQGGGGGPPLEVQEWRRDPFIWAARARSPALIHRVGSVPYKFTNVPKLYRFYDLAPVGLSIVKIYYSNKLIEDSIHDLNKLY